MSKQLTVYANYIQDLEPEFTRLSTSNECGVTFKQEAQYAIQVLDNNDYIRDIAIGNPQSLRNAVLNVGAIGLTLNPIEKKAYLIPRKGKICLDISYMGLVDIATQLGSISFVQAKIVHLEDSFEYNGISSEPTHSYKAFGNRGVKVGVYCVAKTSTGDFLTETMTLEECYEIRNRSEAWKGKKGPSGPWKTDESEMMKKTVIKRASKLWPKTNKTIRLETAIDALNEHEGINFEEERNEQEVSDKEKREAREAQIKKGQQDQEDKYKNIEQITAFSAKLNEGKTKEEKIKFMHETLCVKNFDELKRKSNKDLEQILENLKDMS